MMKLQWCTCDINYRYMALCESAIGSNDKVPHISQSVNNGCIIHNHLEHVMGCISVPNTACIDWDQMQSQTCAHIGSYSSFSNPCMCLRRFQSRVSALLTICCHMLFSMLSLKTLFVWVSLQWLRQFIEFQR